MEEITQLLALTYQGTSQDQIDAAKQELEKFGMSPDFAQILFSISLNTFNDVTLRKSALIYIIVKCAHQLQEIPQETMQFIIQNFPNLIFQIEPEFYKVIIKFSDILCEKCYVHLIQSNNIHIQFLNNFQNSQIIRPASILFKSLMKAVRKLNTSEEIVDSLLESVFDPILQLLQNVTDMFVISRLLDSLQLLLRKTGNDIQYRESIAKYYEALDQYLDHFFQLLQTKGEYFNNFVKSFIIFLKTYLDFRGETSYPNFVALFEKLVLTVHELSDPKVNIRFFRLLESHLQYWTEFVQIPENLSYIMTNIVFPLFVLSEESISKIEYDPISFCYENIYQGGDVNEQYGSVYRCLASGQFDISEFILEFAKASVENYVQTSDAALFYSQMHMCSAAWSKLYSNDLYRNQAIEFLTENAGLLEADLLPRCGFMLLCCAIYEPMKGLPAGYPLILIRAIIAQYEEENVILNYFACTALYTLLVSLGFVESDVKLFQQYADFDTTQFIKIIMAMSEQFHDPSSFVIVTACIRMPFFAAAIKECATDIIIDIFSSVKSAFGEMPEKESIETDLIFNPLINLIESLKDNKELLNSGISTCASQICENIDLFGSKIFFQSLLELASQLISYLSGPAPEFFWQLANLVSQKVRDDQLSDDQQDIFAIMLYNLSVSDIDAARQQIDFFYELLNNFKGESFSNMASLLLNIVPPESPMHAQVMQIAMSRLSEGFEIIMEDPSEAFMFFEEWQNLVFTVLSLFANEFQESVGEYFIPFISNYAEYTVNLLQTLYCFAVMSSMIPPQDLFSNIYTVLDGLSLSNWTQDNSYSDYVHDMMIVRLKIRPFIPVETCVQTVLQFFAQVIQSNPEVAAQAGITNFMTKYEKFVQGGQVDEEDEGEQMFGGEEEM